MRTSLAEGSYGNGPFDAELSRSQAQDLEKAGSMGIQRDSQHQPEGLQSCQFATTVPFFLETSSIFHRSHKGGVEPLCEQLQIRLCHGYPPWNR